LDNPPSYGESTDFVTAEGKKYPAKTRLKLPEVVAGYSKSSLKSSKVPKPNFMEPTAAKNSPIGAFSPNLATLGLCSTRIAWQPWEL